MANVIMSDFEDMIKTSTAYMMESVRVLSDVTHVSSYDSLFNMDDEYVKEAEGAENAATEKSRNWLIKAFTTIKNALAKMFSGIKDFIDRMFLSKEEKEKLEKLEDLIKQNPEMANTKITVKDYRKIYSEIDKMYAELEQAAREVEANKDKPVDKLLKRVGEFLGKNVNVVGTAVTADTAMKLMAHDRGLASQIAFALNRNGTVMTQLIDTLGKEDAEKYRKKANMYAKKHSIFAAMSRLTKKKYDTVEDALKSTMSSLSTQIPLGTGTVGKAMKNNHDTNITRKSVNKGAAKGSLLGALRGKAAVDREVTQNARHRAIDEYINKNHSSNDDD